MVRRPENPLPAQLAMMAATGNMSFDEALLKATASGCFDEFVQSLRQLLGSDPFDREFLADRIHRGICHRALKGQAPLLHLPDSFFHPESHLASHLSQSPTPAPAEEDFPEFSMEPDEAAFHRAHETLRDLNLRMTRIKEEMNDLVVRYRLIKSTVHSDSPSADPWAGTTLILLGTVVVEIALFYGMGGRVSLTLIAAVAVAGTLLSILAFVKAYRNGKRGAHQSTKKSEDRRMKLNALADRISVHEESLENIRHLAKRTLDREMSLVSSQKGKLTEEFHSLFETPEPLLEEESRAS
jgi:hypothetical protein